MNYTYEILDYECVGDSLGKYNYNFINLDDKLCGVSSIFFLDNPNIYKEFNDFLNISESLINIGNVYNDVSGYKEAFTAVTLLSSYWNTPEITVQYPINFVSDSNVSLKNYYLDTIADQNLSLIAQTYINANFPVSEYLPKSIVNISFLLYSSSGEFISTVDGPYQDYPRSQYWIVDFTKNDVYIVKSKNFKFEMVSDVWVNTEIL